MSIFVTPGSPRSMAEKNKLLFQNGINFNDLPRWQKRGVGLFWETYEKPAVNRLMGKAVVTQQRRLRLNWNCRCATNTRYS